MENGNGLFSVSNTGSPIPDEARQRIFDRFYRVDKSHGARVKGSGLGLSLAREIIRAHEGDIWLETAKKELTVFSLSLPLTL